MKSFRWNNWLLFFLAIPAILGYIWLVPQSDYPNQQPRVPRVVGIQQTAENQTHPISGEDIRGAASSREPGSTPMPRASNFILTAPEGRQAYFDALVVQKPQSIWAIWNEAMGRQDPNELWFVINALGFALQRNTDKLVFQQMGNRLADDGSSDQVRQAIIDALRVAATPEAATQLLKYIRAVEEKPFDGKFSKPDLFNEANAALLGMAKTAVNGEKNISLAPILSSAWKSLADDSSPILVNSLAQGLAYLGTIDGATTLIDTTRQSAVSSTKYKAALAGIQTLTENDAVGVLTGLLQQPTDRTEITESVVLGLISIGSVDAVSTLVGYLSKRTDIDKSWLNQINSKLDQRQLDPDAELIIKNWRRNLQ